MNKLLVRVDNEDNLRTADVNFLVVDIPMKYNVILVRQTLSAIKAVIAPYLLLMQFELDDSRVGKLYGDQKMARECDCVSLKSLATKDETPPLKRTGQVNLTKKGLLK